MKLKKLYLLLTIAALFILTLPNCKSDGPCEENSVTQHHSANFSASDLKKVPYTGYDTLVFLDKNGDTCISRGTGKQFYTEQSIERGIPLCPPISITECQAHKIKFVPIKGDMEFDLVHARLGSSIKIDLVNTKVNDPYFEIDYYVINNSQSIKNEYYFDSILINNKWRYAVWNTIVRDEGFSIDDTTYKALINHTEGVLYLKSEKDNKEYSILKSF